MRLKSKTPLFAIEITLQFRRTVYRLNFREVLRWIVPVAMLADRIIRHYCRAGP